jgi:maltose/moltooligosaccharide transporter
MSSENSDMTSEHSTSGHPSFRLLINMNAGFFGVQVANGLQTANASAIFESLGAEPSQLPLLWLGAPVTGFITQTLIGHLSDRTWSRWGRRQPFFLGGAVLGTGMLLTLIHATALWQAAVLYWILQLALNTNIAPARPFVGDMLPADQHTLGYAIQGFCIGSGAILASGLPWLTEHWLNLTAGGDEGIPQSIQWAYQVGAALLITGTIWTFWRVDEPRPAIAHPVQHQDLTQSIKEFWTAFGDAVINMPAIMRKLAWVQIFTWIGIYSIFLYLPTAIALNILGASSKQSPEYVHGVEWAGVCIAFYNLICLGVSLMIPTLSRVLGRVTTHVLCLMCGGIGLTSLLFMHDRYPILLSMVGVGIAWASILSIPYALLVDELNENQRGIYMGLFNCFVTLPQIAVSLGFGWLMDAFLQGDRLWALAIGGLSMGVAALFMLRVTDPQTEYAGQRSVEQAVSE